MREGSDDPQELKPFRAHGLVRRVTPFIGAGLIALVVFADPTFSRLAWADALAVAVAAGVIVAALSPIDWNRLPRLTMAAPLVVGILLALAATLTQGSPISFAAAAAGTLVIAAIYVVPWDRLPRWVHNLPVFGGIGAVWVIQATVPASSYAVATVLLVFPLYLTTVLFAALYHTRNEVWAAAALASIGILALAISSADQPGQPALSILVVAVLWVVVLTVHEVVRQSHIAEERIRLLISSVREYAIITLDPTGRVTSWNAAAEQIKGYRAEEIVGRDFSCFYVEEDVKAGKPGLELAEAARVGRFEDEGWRLRKDGSRFWADVVIAPLRDEDGGLRGFAKVTRDITERRKSEQALAESQARLQAIVDTSLTAIVTMDRNGLISGWNPQAQATFGWSRTEILGKPVADTIIPKQHRNAHRTGLERYLATGEGPVLGKVLELTALDRQGREFPVELAISLASAPGAEPLFVGFVRDMTARKQSEASIQALNRELQIANQHKSEFLANMSHELRTPLNAILGFSELMFDDTSDKYDAATRQKFLAQINSSGKHLLSLINDILDLSKVEAGQMTLKVETVSVVDIVHGVLSTIEPMATKKRIRISADVEDAGQLEADAGKLKQMLLNLVTNAVKFTPEAGVVTIESHRLENAIEISVADTGIGIADSDLPRLFKEFQQLDTGAGRQQEGTGLGLALTKRLAELHGGDVRVVSKPGRGSTFTIRLPQRAADVAHRVSVPAPAASGEARPLVLVVEDNHQAAELLVRQLDGGGFRAEIALSGTEAVAKARELQPIAITLDILLPGIDGWDVLERLKRDEATRDIPVVVISVLDKPELGRALGAMDYFVKPVDGKALLARLSKYTFMSRVGTEDTRILVVDDEPANLQWLEGVLKPAGFSVTSAHGGREGIDLARESHPHLILLDLIMPEVSGFDVVEALHEDEATRSIPIMILTGKDLTDDDKRQLNGHVAAIVARRSTEATDLLGWLNRLMAARPGTTIDNGNG